MTPSILRIPDAREDSDIILTKIGDKYYLTIDQLLLAYKKLAFS